jgi:hypothetical protein
LCDAARAPTILTMTLTNSQKATLAAILDDEIASQHEDPTTPHALDEALDLRGALARGDELAVMS